MVKDAIHNRLHWEVKGQESSVDLIIVKGLGTALEKALNPAINKIC